MSDSVLMPEDKIYWGRAIGGCILGLLTTIFRLDRFGSIVAIIIAITVYFVSTIVLRVLIDSETRATLGRKLYLTGSGTYGALWLLTWIFSHNLM
ncbi:MAG: hypothetical protein QXF28_00645 [Nitrososphaerota archaeon]